MQNDIRAKIVQVIEVEHLRTGEDGQGLPTRWVKTFWDMKGTFLAEHDPLLEEARRKHVGAATTTETFRR